MKRLLTLLAAVGVCFSAIADEGMWLLPYIKKMNSKDLKEHGCKLKPEDIYSAEKSSLKDAIVLFGTGIQPFLRIRITSGKLIELQNQFL